MAVVLRNIDPFLQAACKLGDSSGGKVDVVSTWKTTIQVSAQAAQTELITMSSNGTQSSLSEDAEVQTDEARPSAAQDPALEAAEEARVAADLPADVDATDMLEDTSVTLRLELRSPFEASSVPPQASTSGDGLSGLVITGITWNSTGNVVAVSYGRLDIRGWCSAPGALCTWNVGRRNGRSGRAGGPKVDTEKPDTVIQLDNCLMCVAFHPTHPALIAGGTFNGEIYLWDLGREDPQRAKSRITDFSHREPVTQLSWQYSASEAFSHIGQEHAYQVVSTSTDGKVLIWSIAKLEDPIYGYELLHARAGQKELFWGATCLALATSSSKDEQSSFVVGTEGGVIFHCLMRHNDLMVADFAQKVNGQAFCSAVMPGDSSLKLKSPVRSEFASHVGAVRACARAPFHRNLFLTCGSDGCLRVYSVLQPKALLQLSPSRRALTAAQWSPVRPLLIATAAEDGHVHFYDLQRSLLQPCKSVRIANKGRAVSAMAFNPKAPDCFAAVDGSTLKIYTLGASFKHQRAMELSAIDRIEQLKQ